jgi:hypothetical protein
MPSAQPLWHSFKTATGYDAANSRSILHHALHAWYFWHECSSAKSHSWPVLCVGFGSGSTRATGMATLDDTHSTLCTIVAAIQDLAPAAPASACQEASGPPGAPSSLIPPRVWPQVLARKVGVTAGTRTRSTLARSPGTATTPAPRGVGARPSRLPPGALQARSRSAVAPVVAEQHSPGSSMADSVLWGENNLDSVLSVARASSERVSHIQT